MNFSNFSHLNLFLNVPLKLNSKVSNFKSKIFIFSDFRQNFEKTFSVKQREISFIC